MEAMFTYLSDLVEAVDYQAAVANAVGGCSAEYPWETDERRWAEWAEYARLSLRLDNLRKYASKLLEQAIYRGYGIARAACRVAAAWVKPGEFVCFEDLSGEDIARFIELNGGPDDKAHRKWARHYRENWSALSHYE